jgi:hypothetical protein
MRGGWTGGHVWPGEWPRTVELVPRAVLDVQCTTNCADVDLSVEVRWAT